jgi:hypothetical protein
MQIVDGASAVVNKTDHREGDRDGAVRRFEERAESVCLVAVKTRRVNKTPNHGRVAASLACAIKREDGAIGVSFVRDAKFSLEFVFGLL